MGNYYIGSVTSKHRRELWHYGVPNQKWGVRNYQNLDGSLTQAGRAHYGIGPGHSDDEEDPESVANKIKSMAGQLQDPETEKELDFYISNVKSGRMSAEEALAAAQQAVELDKQRAEYRAKKAAAEEKKKQAAAKKASGGSSRKSSGSSKSKKSSDDEEKKKQWNTEWIDRDTQQRNLIGNIQNILRRAESGAGDNSAVMDIVSQLRSALASGGSAAGPSFGSMLGSLGSRASVNAGSRNDNAQLHGTYNDIMKLIQDQQRRRRRAAAVRRRG